MNEHVNSSKQKVSRPLHFVNTDPGTLGAEDAGKRTRDVKSHLSGHYRRWKKQQTLGAQATSSEGQASAEDSGASTPILGDCNEAGGLAFVPFSTSSFEYPAEDDDVSEDALVEAGEQLEMPGALRNSSSRPGSDPLTSQPTSADQVTDAQVQLFLQLINVMYWTKGAKKRVEDLLQHEAFKQGVLAISKIIMATYLPDHQNSTVLLPESRRHYGELLRLMRTYFEDETNIDSNLAIELIHAATMFSFLAKEYDDFELHLLSLKSLIDNLGGLRAIDYFHSLRYLNAERLRALFLQKAPLTPLSEWAPGSWLQEDCFRPYDSMYENARSLMSSPNIPILPRGNFSQQVQILILDHRDLLTAGSVAANLFRAKKPGVDIISGWLSFRSHALTIRTAKVVKEITALKQSKPSLELRLHASACLAANFMAHLVHFSVNTTVGLSYIPLPMLIQQLQQTSKEIRLGAQLQHQDLYLWCLFVGACAELASRTWSCDPSFRGSSWCSINLARMIEKLGIDNLADLKANLRQFLFPYLFESYMKVLFDKRHELIKLSENV